MKPRPYSSHFGTTVKDIGEIGPVFESIRNAIGVKHLTYVAFSLGGLYTLNSESEQGTLNGDVGHWWRLEGGYGLGISTYPLEWLLEYSQNQYSQIDPVAEGIRSRFSGFDWRDLDWSAKKRRRFLLRAIECGIGSRGYILPIWGPDGQLAMTVINDDTLDETAWEELKKENFSKIVVFSHELHRVILNIENMVVKSACVRLSAREEHIMKLLAVGRTRAQIAHDMSISENTVRVYIDNARVKLNAVNTIQAVANGVKRGQIII